ncbi:hypothetical protein [Candidatus Poriferisocius sp.]|uniref:hypothetical protein n=1 Tax=Candidatus Poriferisocius sp. TaxID=3101276 RepID=UPI003B51E3FB
MDKIGHDNDPFIAGAGFAIGKSIAVALFLAVFGRKMLLTTLARTVIRSRLMRYTLLLGAVSHFDYSLYTWATYYVDTAVASVFFELYPIVLIFFMARLLGKIDGRVQRYRRLKTHTIVTSFIAIFGLVFVILSPTGSFNASPDISQRSLALGLLLAMATTLIGGLTAFHFVWGEEVAARIIEKSEDERPRQSAELMCGVLSYCIGNIIVTPINLAVGLRRTDSIHMESFGWTVLAGAVLMGCSSLFFRKSNLMTDNLGVNSITYLTPVLGLLWLSLYTDIDVARFDYFAMGATAIVAANLLINVDPEEQFGTEAKIGFRSLIVSLWIFGVFVYLRDEILGEWAAIDFAWKDSEYWGMLGLSTTIFILILVFRVSRLVDRTAYEDRLFISLFRKSQSLIDSGSANIDRSILDDVMMIDISTSKRRSKLSQSSYADYENSDPLLDAYLRASSKLDAGERHARDSSKSDIQGAVDSITEIRIDLDSLVYSKQHGREFGELVALAVFACISVCLITAVRPSESLSGWNGFVVEIFAVMFASVIVFLLFNFVDMSRERDTSTFERRGRAPRSTSLQPNEQRVPIYSYGVFFRTPYQLRVERFVSASVGFGVMVAFGALFWFKWL